MLGSLTTQVRSAGELTPSDIQEVVGQLTDPSVPDESKAAFLSALAQRGETPAEITGFVKALRKLSVPVPVDEDTRSRGILDVCGTGGDHQNTFNISTTVALVVASAGVAVAKHGNRAVTSKSGSADVLEALRIPIDLSPEESAAALRDQHFTFFFAPRYHPAFRHIAGARKLCAAAGQRTIFNLLGPLMNPARPTAQLVGVPQPAWCAPLAEVLRDLGVGRAMVVCGRAGNGYLDELSILGDTHLAEFHHERGFSVSTLALADLPVRPVLPAELQGGDATANAVVVRRILGGDERGPCRDAVLLNAGAALFLAGRAKSITEGWELAGSLIDSGRAAAKLAQLQR